MPHPLLVVSVDGMCLTDLPFLRTLPAFGRLLERGSFASARSVLPALTYPNHVSLITGRTVAGHGVYGNMKLAPGATPTDWFWQAADLDCPTIFDLAKAQGLRTASFFWPGTAHAEIDVLVPVLWDPEDWSDPRRTLGPASSPGAFPALFDKHLDKLRWQPGPDYDEFAIALTAEVLAERSADVVFSHLLAVDKARHRTGVASDTTRDALVGIDGGLQVLLAALESAGRLASTNIILTSDHGHTDVVQAVAPNVLLAEAGLIRLDADGAVTSWDAWVHPAGLSGQVHLRPDADGALRARVLQVLDGWVQDSAVPISAVHSAAQVRDAHGFAGPFAAVLEAADATVIQPRWQGAAVVSRFEESYRGPRSAHGGFPEVGIPPLMIAAGPDIVPGLRLDQVSVVDQAATCAALIGVQIPDADGVAVRELLGPDGRSTTTPAEPTTPEQTAAREGTLFPEGTTEVEVAPGESVQVSLPEGSLGVGDYWDVISVSDPAIAAADVALGEKVFGVEPAEPGVDETGGRTEFAVEVEGLEAGEATLRVLYCTRTRKVSEDCDQSHGTLDTPVEPVEIMVRVK